MIGVIIRMIISRIILSLHLLRGGVFMCIRHTAKRLMKYIRDEDERNVLFAELLGEITTILLEEIMNIKDKDAEQISTESLAYLYSLVERYMETKTGTQPSQTEEVSHIYA